MLRRWAGVAAMAVAVTGVAAQASAQARPAAAPAAAAQAKAPLPTGEALLAKYVQAVGGQEAFDKIKNRTATGSLDLGAAGVKLSLVAYSAKPDRIYLVMDSDMTGRIESGVADGVAWENSSIRGALVKDGAERADAIRDATFDRLVYWKETTKSAECTGTADVEGKPAYKVVVTPKVGSAQTIYFDKDTSLIVEVDTTATVSGQTVEIVSRPGDYRQVDGIKIPFRTVQVVMGQERVLTFDKVQNNVEMAADRFAPPAAIKAIVDKK